MDGGPPSFIHGNAHIKFDRSHGEWHFDNIFFRGRG